uniref:hypothetical protein n=1 Tax=Paraburkholderia sp. SG-MS1 TaxID=2023741 RepID=UPI001EEB300C|nr:hypothetical protein [Paraburkholderia sp. SG-MS1]
MPRLLDNELHKVPRQFANRIARRDDRSGEPLDGANLFAHKRSRHLQDKLRHRLGEICMEGSRGVQQRHVARLQKPLPTVLLDPRLTICLQDDEDSLFSGLRETSSPSRDCMQRRLDMNETDYIARLYHHCA